MKTSSKVSSIVMSLCEVIVGILLLVNPVGFTVGILTFLGITLVVIGFAGVVQYFRDTPEKAAVEQSLTRGFVEILIGLFLIVKNEWFIATFPLLTIIYGVGTLVLGIAKIQWTVDMIRLKVKKWFWEAISAVLTVLFAVIILCNPFSSTSVLWTFVAVTLIIEAVVDVIVVIFARKDKAES